MIPSCVFSPEDVYILHPKCMWLKIKTPIATARILLYHTITIGAFIGIVLFQSPKPLPGIWLCTCVIVYIFSHRVNSLEKYRNSVPSLKSVNLLYNYSIICSSHGSTCWSLIALAITTFASFPPFFQELQLTDIFSIELWLYFLGLDSCFLLTLHVSLQVSFWLLGRVVRMQLVQVVEDTQLNTQAQFKVEPSRH